MPSRSQLVIWAEQAARKYGVPEQYFLRQINQESGWNVNARSPAGAMGIAQFMPGTARGMGINPMNPQQALFAAARMDAQAYHEFHSWAMAFAAYNAGSGAVQHYGGVPPYAETQHYVAVIMGGPAQDVSTPHEGGFHPGKAGQNIPVPSGVNKGAELPAPPNQGKGAGPPAPPNQGNLAPHKRQPIPTPVDEGPGLGPPPESPYIAPYKQAAQLWEQIASQPGSQPETQTYANNSQVLIGAGQN